MTDLPFSSDDAALLARVKRTLEPVYEVESELGRGGMAVVYRARDPRLKRSVAIKVLPPELAFRGDIRARFLREAETSARLSHPNIVPIYSVDEREGLVYFVMGLVDGESLGAKLRREKTMTSEATRRVMREVADALAYAHAHGVVHRDVKPDNVLLDAAGRAMVTDFGIARAAAEGDSRLTATGAALGTPSYMSPEQCSGERELDGRSDLYSLGTVAYQMLTGNPPFVGGSAPAVMVKHVAEMPRPIRTLRPEVPRDLEQIVMRLLEKEPANRFADGAALISALDGGPMPALSPSASASASTGRPWAEPWQTPVAPPPLPFSPMPPMVFGSPMPMAPPPGYGMSPPLGRRGLSREMRVRLYRRKVVGTVASVAMFAMFWRFFLGQRHFPGIFFIPVVFGGFGLFRRGANIWADGADDPVDTLRPPNNTTPPSMLGYVGQPSAPKAPYDPRVGVIVRQAIVDRKSIADAAATLGSGGGWNAEIVTKAWESSQDIHDHILSLSAGISRLDSEIAVTTDASLRTRLSDSRGALFSQMENAGALLRNLALDTLTLGVPTPTSRDAIDSVTQQARALSKEIGYALAAADELRQVSEKTRF